MKNTNSLIVCFLSNTNIGTNKYLCCARTHSPQAIFGNESPLLQSHTRWCAPYVRTRPQNSWPFSQQLKMRLHAMRLVVPEQYNPAFVSKKENKIFNHCSGMHSFSVNEGGEAPGRSGMGPHPGSRDAPLMEVDPDILVRLWPAERVLVLCVCHCNSRPLRPAPAFLRGARGGLPGRWNM